MHTEVHLISSQTLLVHVFCAECLAIHVWVIKKFSQYGAETWAVLGKNLNAHPAFDCTYVY